MWHLLEELSFKNISKTFISAACQFQLDMKNMKKYYYFHFSLNQKKNIIDFTRKIFVILSLMDIYPEKIIS